jgi:hypothetical protein
MKPEEILVEVRSGIDVQIPETAPKGTARSKVSL